MPLSAKQNEYVRNANARWNVKAGAVRSGKSYVDTAFMIPWRLRQVSGRDGLAAIFGVSVSTIERNVLQPMRELYTDRLVGGINSARGTASVLGEEVYCIGMEKSSSVAKIQGMSLKYAYGDEIAKWNREAFAMLESRLDKEYSKFDGACNPEGPSHWFKKWMDNPKLDLYRQDYVLEDNPFLPPSFVRALRDEYEGTVYFDRYILGKWALAEGIIYPMYEEAVAEPPEGEPDDYRLSIDYGTMNAFAALLWARHGKVWHCVEEYYYSGRDKGVTRTDEEYAEALDGLIGGVMEKREQAVKEGRAEFARKMRTIIDPSAASFIATLRKRKRNAFGGWYGVVQADNAVLDGIRDTATAMRLGLIKISPKCENLIRELQGYVWDDKAGEDRPVDVNNHACDATRYFVYTEKIVTRSRKIMLSMPTAA